MRDDGGGELELDLGLGSLGQDKGVARESVAIGDMHSTRKVVTRSVVGRGYGLREDIYQYIRLTPCFQNCVHSSVHLIERFGEFP